MEKTIKYTVEFDTTKAEKAMADLQSNETKGPSSSEHTIDAPEIGKSIGENFMTNMKAGLPQMLGSIFGGGNLKSILGGMAGNLTKAIGQSAGGASEAAAGAGGAAEGLGGLAASAGPIGLVVAGVAALGMAVYKATEALMDFGRTLSQYSGVLYQSVSNFDLKMQGLQIEMSGKLGGVLSSLFDTVGGLAQDLAPIATVIIGALTIIIQGLLNGLRWITIPLRFVGDLLNDFGKLTQSAWDAIGSAVKPLIDAFKGGAKAIGDVILKVGNVLHSDTLKDIGNTLSGNDAAGDATKEMNSVLISALRDWAFNSKGMGMQGTVGGGSLQSQAIPWKYERETIHGKTRDPLSGLSPISDDVRKALHLHDKSPIEKMVHDSKADSKKGLPKPSPAAMHYHQTDHIQMQLHDQDSINQERLAFLDRVNDKVTALRDITWLTRQKSIGQSFARTY